MREQIKKPKKTLFFANKFTNASTSMGIGYTTQLCHTKIQMKKKTEQIAMRWDRPISNKMWKKMKLGNEFIDHRFI